MTSISDIKEISEDVVVLFTTELSNLGFQEKHITKVLQIHSTIPDALDWLCLNLPEHELPVGFDPRGKQLEVSLEL